MVTPIVLVGRAEVTVNDGPTVVTWSARCTCGWRATKPRDTREQAQDEAIVHSIAEGHQPAWLEKWPD